MIRLALQSLEYYVFLKHVLYNGLVAQWITRLTTDQKIAGSNPARIDLFLRNSHLTKRRTSTRTFYRRRTLHQRKLHQRGRLHQRSLHFPGTLHQR